MCCKMTHGGCVMLTLCDMSRTVAQSTRKGCVIFSAKPAAFDGWRQVEGKRTGQQGETIYY